MRDSSSVMLLGPVAIRANVLLKPMYSRLKLVAIALQIGSYEI